MHFGKWYLSSAVTKKLLCWHLEIILVSSSQCHGEGYLAGGTYAYLDLDVLDLAPGLHIWFVAEHLVSDLVTCLGAGIWDILSETH